MNKTCPLLSISTRMSDAVGCNDNSVLCLEIYCALWDDSPNRNCCSLNTKVKHAEKEAKANVGNN